MTDETPQPDPPLEGTPPEETKPEELSPEVLALAADWEACLAYFHAATHEPLSVVPWSQWWTEWEERAARVFSMADYVRLKHRKLKGGRQILQLLGRLEKEYAPPHHVIKVSCPDCGERTTDSGERYECPQCKTSWPVE